MDRLTDPEMVPIFVEEVRGYLPQIRECIAAYRASDATQDGLELAYRFAHTIKGAAALMGLSSLSRVAHIAEVILERCALDERLLREDEVNLVERVLCEIDEFIEQLDGGGTHLDVDELVSAHRQLGASLDSQPSGRANEIGADGVTRSVPDLEVPLLEDSPFESEFYVAPVAEKFDGEGEVEALADMDLEESLENESWPDSVIADSTEINGPLVSEFVALEGESVGTAETAEADLLGEIDIDCPTDHSDPRSADPNPVLAAGAALDVENAIDPMDATESERTRSFDDTLLVDEDWSAEIKGEGPSRSQIDDLFNPGFDAEPETPLPVVGEDLSTIGADAHEDINVMRAVVEEESVTPPVEPADPPASPASLLDDDGDVSEELREIFAIEAEEHLLTINSVLPRWASAPSPDLLQEIRRAVHTLKGSAGMAGMHSVSHLSHRMEDLLDELYEGHRESSVEISKLLFDCTDVLDDLAMNRVDPNDGTRHLKVLYERFDLTLGVGSAQAEEAEPDSGNELEPDLLVGPIEASDWDDASKEPIPTVEPEPAISSAAGVQSVRIPLDRLNELGNLVGELAINRTAFEQRMQGLTREVDELRPSIERLRRVSVELGSEYEIATLGDSSSARSGAAVSESGVSEEFDSLEFDRYTEFHRLLRELVESTDDINSVSHGLSTVVGDFDGAMIRQRRLSTEIQDELMHMRMVPLATLATRLYRSVRNVGSELGKDLRLVIEGEHVEHDKTVLDELADPLLHILRNSADHGIETPAERHAAGKTPDGLIRIVATYEGTQVVIRVSDDGRGLNSEEIREQAIRSGLVAADELATWPDERLHDLIFQPGFSTAREISQVSGRGVGMDIVRSQVERLKGTVSLDSIRGQGTTITIRLPITLAILRALVVGVGDRAVALPLASVSQILKIDPSQIERIGNDEVLRIENVVRPVVRLSDVMSSSSTPDLIPNSAAESESGAIPTLFVTAAGQEIALIVDRMMGAQEIVIKTLGNVLRHVDGLMGATLTGDGRVLLILNPDEMFVDSQATQELPLLDTEGSVSAARNRLDVMIVDDSLSVRRVVGNLITSVGWDMTTARDGLEALEMLQQGGKLPDIVLLDVEMPRMNGYELLRILRETEAFKDLPVVFLTSRAGAKHRKKAIDLGATDYLVKPYQDEILLETMRRLTGSVG